MQILFDSASDLESLRQSIARLEDDPDTQSIMILLPSGNDHDAQDLSDLLKNVRKPLFGGIFPAVLHAGKMHREGHLLLGFSSSVDICLIDPLEPDAATRLCSLNTSSGTLFVFVDGLSPHVGPLIEEIYNRFALDIHYLGGGCGNWELQPLDCILSNQGATRNAALLCMAPGLYSDIGVAHGWQPVSDPIKVTESRDGRLITLDWKPARQVYRDHLRHHAGIEIDSDNFSAIASNYPFGIARLDAEMVIRDPYALDGNDILCLGDVPSGSHVHIMHADAARLLKAAHQARQRATVDTAAGASQCELVMDCISRALFLGDLFDHELKAFETPGAPMVGALTIGEIANHGDDYLEFYNKTAVVGILS